MHRFTVMADDSRSLHFNVLSTAIIQDITGRCNVNVDLVVFPLLGKYQYIHLSFDKLYGSATFISLLWSY